MTSRIVLVRHGESKDNRRDLMSGLASCAGLSEHGEEQVRFLAERWEGDGFRPDVIMTSGVRRARETAAILGQRLHLVPVIDNELRELEMGEWEGDTWSSHHDYVNRMWSDDHELRFGETGESINEAYDRMEAALLKVVANYPDQIIVVVTHAYAMFAATDRLLHEPNDALVMNASLTELQNDHGRWTLVRYNDHSHLSS